MWQKTISGSCAEFWSESSGAGLPSGRGSDAALLNAAARGHTDSDLLKKLGDEVTGVVVGVLAIIRLSMRQPGWSWLDLILGIWHVISPFALFLGIAAMWNNVIRRVIVAAFALSNTYSKVSTPIGI